MALDTAHRARRLGQASLRGLPPEVGGPAYDRNELVAGIIHIGIGAFHRAHMADYVDRLLALDPGWAIIGASLRRPDTREALQPQQYLYSLHSRGEDGVETKVVGSVIDIIDASASTRSLIDQMARPSTRIVSLTVTEKGYCHEPATGALQLHHPDIMHDLANRQTPRSVPGILVAALAERRARGHGGFTVLSCDNLQGNGKIVRGVVLGFAQLHDPSLAEWIAAQVRFPGTMVDRIVPSTTEEDRAAAARVLGLEDAWPVVTEPFSQWVIEDDFVAGRPAFETVGVEMVEDVEPFEQMKLRMLNGSHSAIAYLGLLLGKSFVADVVADERIREFLRRLMYQEVAPTLHLPRADMEAYADRLLRRFANPQLFHRCAQIAMDGSQKLPPRLLAPIRETLAQGKPVRGMALTVAAWIAYLERQARTPEATLADPMADLLIGLVQSAGPDSRDLVRAVLSVETIAGTDLVKANEFSAVVSEHLDRIRSEGPLAAVEAALPR